LWQARVNWDILLKIETHVLQNKEGNVMDVEEGCLFRDANVHLLDEVPITEIALYGEGEMRLDLYPTKLRLTSTVPCTMRRFPPNRLVVNYESRLVIQVLPTGEGLYATLGNVDNDEVERANMAVFGSMREVVERFQSQIPTIDSTLFRSNEWTVEGIILMIDIVEKHNTSGFTVMNRAFNHRSLRIRSPNLERSLRLGGYERDCLGHHRGLIEGWGTASARVFRVWERQNLPGQLVNLADPGDVKRHYDACCDSIANARVPFNRMDPGFKAHFQILSDAMKRTRNFRILGGEK
jgi:hypothetical protein